MHGPDQRHNTDDCKVINAEIEKLKGKKPSFNNQQDKKTSWNDRKRTAISYSTEQMKDVVRMTRKKAMVDAKSKYEEQLQEELHAIEIRSDESEHKSKMQAMELFINNPDGESDMEGGDDDLTQAEIDELTASISEEWSHESGYYITFTNNTPKEINTNKHKNIHVKTICWI